LSPANTATWAALRCLRADLSSAACSKGPALPSNAGISPGPPPVGPWRPSSSPTCSCDACDTRRRYVKSAAATRRLLELANTARGRDSDGRPSRGGWIGRPPRGGSATLPDVTALVDETVASGQALGRAAQKADNRNCADTEPVRAASCAATCCPRSTISRRASTPGDRTSDSWLALVGDEAPAGSE
jgi:hypothetical protein